MRKQIINWCKNQGLDIVDLYYERQGEYIYGDFQGFGVCWYLVLNINNKKETFCFDPYDSRNTAWERFTSDIKESIKELIHEVN